MCRRSRCGGEASCVSLSSIFIYLTNYLFERGECVCTSHFLYLSSPFKTLERRKDNEEQNWETSGWMVRRGHWKDVHKHCFKRFFLLSDVLCHHFSLSRPSCSKSRQSFLIQSPSSFLNLINSLTIHR